MTGYFGVYFFPFTNKRTDMKWARRTLTGPCFFPITNGNGNGNGNGKGEE